MREDMRRVNISPKETDNLVNPPTFKNEDTGKIFEALSEKMKLMENNKETLTILEELSERIKFLETQETPYGTEINSCSFKHTCYTAKSKMGSCPCELYR